MSKRLAGTEMVAFTTYGGEDFVPIQRIDFEEAVRLNAYRGVDFVLRPKPAALSRLQPIRRDVNRIVH